MKNKLGSRFVIDKWTVIVLIASLLVFIVCSFALRTEPEETSQAADYVEYERATVIDLLGDTSEIDPVSDNSYRGEQLLTAEVKTGQYKGKILQAYNYIGPLYGVRLNEGDSIVLTISTYSTGEVMATVYEYNRYYPLLFVVGIFILITILVGRGTGAKSLLALAVTVICLFNILLPALIKGAPTILTTLFVSVYITIVSLAIIGGLKKKTICAMIGTTAGTIFAAVFGILSQTLLKVNGLRISEVEPLLQLRQTGESGIGLKGLLVAGVIISAIGAVMDVAMSISSALSEVHDANPSYGTKELFKSGMNIGRDMVGTMTNTLILAFLGSSFTLILYFSSLNLTFWQLMSSAYVSLEVISGLACSAGLILAIPLTAIVSAYMYSRDVTATSK